MGRLILAGDRLNAIAKFHETARPQPVNCLQFQHSQFIPPPPHRFSGDRLNGIGADKKVQRVLPRTLALVIFEQLRTPRFTDKCTESFESWLRPTN